MRKSLSLINLLIMVFLVASSVPVLCQQKEDDRLQQSYQVLKEILGMPEGIPRDLLNKAECVVIYPDHLPERGGI